MNTDKHGFKNFLIRVYPIVVILLVGASAHGERFLTVEEALRVCFPKATNFSAHAFALSADEMKQSKSKAKAARVWIAEQDGKVIGYLMPDQVIGKHDFIDYAVAVSTNGSVLQVEILEYREHYGTQVRQPKWREQFAGKNAGAPLKLGHDIYNISGATLSCRHVTEGVKRVLVTFELVVRPRLRLPAQK